jgi:DNA-binding NtrC family response regulator
MAHILALDDVSDAAQLIRRILERKGHNVKALTNEDEALRYVERNPVDMVILDMKLKRMSGVEVLRKMKALRPQLRAIMLTGYPTLDTAHASLRLGASAYCVKPIDKSELEATVERVLSEPNTPLA